MNSSIIAAEDCHFRCSFAVSKSFVRPGWKSSFHEAFVSCRAKPCYNDLWNPTRHYASACLTEELLMWCENDPYFSALIPLVVKKIEYNDQTTINNHKPLPTKKFMTFQELSAIMISCAESTVWEELHWRTPRCRTDLIYPIWGHRANVGPSKVSGCFCLFMFWKRRFRPVLQN